MPKEFDLTTSISLAFLISVKKYVIPLQHLSTPRRNVRRKPKRYVSRVINVHNRGSFIPAFCKSRMTTMWSTSTVLYCTIFRRSSFWWPTSTNLVREPNIPKMGTFWKWRKWEGSQQKTRFCIHSSIPKAAENLMEPFERTTSVAFGVNSFYLWLPKQQNRVEQTNWQWLVRQLSWLGTVIDQLLVLADTLPAVLPWSSHPVQPWYYCKPMSLCENRRTSMMGPHGHRIKTPLPFLTMYWLLQSYWSAPGWLWVDLSGG